LASASSASASVAVVGYLLPEADGMERQRPPHSPKESVAASTPMKAYHLRRQGNCLDSITSLEECQIAASILLLSTRRAVSDDDGDGHGGGAPWYPPGCYSHRGNALRFNSPPVPPPAAVGAAGADAKPPNTGKCSPALPCLCRGPTNASSPSRVKISASISPWNGRRAALSSTWDDGSDSQVTFVPTLLGSYNLSGTFYLSPQFLDPVDDRPTPDVLPNKWEYARRNYFPNAEEEWGKTAVVRHEVAAHTLSHSRFDDPTMTGEDASRDFAEVDRRLEAEFSSLLLQPLSMSWPFGVYHPEALRAARDHGYASGRTTKCGYIPWGIEPENDWLTLPSCELIGNDDDHHRVMIQKAIDGVIDDDDNGKKKKKKKKGKAKAVEKGADQNVKDGRRLGDKQGGGAAAAALEQPPPPATGTWLILHGHAVQSCEEIGDDGRRRQRWIDNPHRLVNEKTKYHNAGLAQGKKHVESIINTRTGEVRECRYGWAGLQKRTMMEHAKYLARKRDEGELWVAPVGIVSRYLREGLAYEITAEVESMVMRHDDAEGVGKEEEGGAGDGDGNGVLLVLSASLKDGASPILPDPVPLAVEVRCEVAESSPPDEQSDPVDEQDPCLRLVRIVRNALRDKPKPKRRIVQGHFVIEKTASSLEDGTDFDVASPSSSSSSLRGDITVDVLPENDDGGGEASAATFVTLLIRGYRPWDLPGGRREMVLAFPAKGPGGG